MFLPHLPILMWPFYPLWRELFRWLVFSSSLVGIVSYVAVDFVCLWEEVNSESSYTTILDCPLLDFLHSKFVLLLSSIVLK